MKLPENATLVPKRVAVGTLHEVCFVFIVLFYFTKYILFVNILNTREYLTRIT
jgi:hypothetical protein